MTNYFTISLDKHLFGKKATVLTKETLELGVWSGSLFTFSTEVFSHACTEIQWPVKMQGLQ